MSATYCPICKKDCAALTAEKDAEIERLKEEVKAGEEFGGRQLAHTVELEADLARLRSALERLKWNFELVLSGKPCKEADEALSEARAALESTTPQEEK